MSNVKARAAIVAEAISWLNTPYHHHGRVKGVGVDCAQMPIAVYSACGLIPALNVDYSPQWMMHRDEEQYLEYVLPYAREIDRADVLPGDLAMWKFGRTYSHSAIVISMPSVIHAMNRAGMVVYGDADRDADLIDRPVRYFSMFGAR